LGIGKKSVSISKYIQTGIYAIMRKCPTAHTMLGKSSIWELSTREFRWIIENLGEEFKTQTRKK